VKRKMKVLILATDIYTRGGIARHTYTFASALADLLGPENVDVLALLAYGDPSDLQPQFRVLGPVSDRLTPVAKIRFVMKALALARNGYDLIVCSHLSFALLAAAIRLAYKTPYWVACYGMEAWARLPLFKRVALRQSDLLLPISRFTAQKLSEVNDIPQDRMSIVYTMLPDHLVRLLTAPVALGGSEVGARNRERTLLSVGSLERPLAYKGFDTVIRALPVVLARVPDARYAIVGEGDDRPRLEQLTAELELENQVTFAGSVSDAQLAEFYRSCDVFVLPSKVMERNGSWEGEGFGRVYVEAALAGKPVVGSSAGGAAEAVLHGNTGLRVEPSSREQIARAIIQLLENPKVAREMGCAGRKWALENFTQEALRRRLAQLLEPRFGGEACRS
jgi:glycosyltransferase involved in cell wall biosynthesis